jgi:hypothetical protein
MSKESPPKPTTAETRFSINEDWAATILGLVLLGLVLVGAIPTGVVP